MPYSWVPFRLMDADTIWGYTLQAHSVCKRTHGNPALFDPIYSTCRPQFMHHSSDLTAWPEQPLLLQAEASKWAEKRDAYAHDSQKASEHTAEMDAAAGEAEQKLERLHADIAQAKKRLTALDRSAACLVFTGLCPEPCLYGSCVSAESDLHLTHGHL